MDNLQGVWETVQAVLNNSPYYLIHGFFCHVTRKCGLLKLLFQFFKKKTKALLVSGTIKYGI